jgi:hypothetical protein
MRLQKVVTNIVMPRMRCAPFVMNTGWRRERGVRFIHNPCGSEPARESGVPGETSVIVKPHSRAGSLPQGSIPQGIGAVFAFLYPG